MLLDAQASQKGEKFGAPSLRLGDTLQLWEIRVGVGSMSCPFSRCRSLKISEMRRDAALQRRRLHERMRTQLHVKHVIAWPKKKSMHENSGKLGAQTHSTYSCRKSRSQNGVLEASSQRPPPGSGLALLQARVPLTETVHDVRAAWRAGWRGKSGAREHSRHTIYLRVNLILNTIVAGCCAPASVSQHILFYETNPISGIDNSTITTVQML